MQDILDIEKPTAKIYKENSIWLAAFLGGPLAAGYIIAQNFKTCNEPAKVRNTWIITILASIFILTGMLMLSDYYTRPMNQFIPILYTGIASMIMKHYQSNLIKEHIRLNGKSYSWARVALVGFIGLMIIIAGIIATVIIDDITSKLLLL